MDWLKFALGAVQLLGVLVTFLREKQLLDAGAVAAIARAMKAQADDVQKIHETMAAAGKRFDANGGMPGDGKYRD